MIQEGSKVYVPYRLVDETDNAGNVGTVTAISPGGYEESDIGASEPTPRIFTVKFSDWSEEGFHFEDLEKFKILKYLPEWWIHEGKEKAKKAVTISLTILLLGSVLWLAMIPKKTAPTAPKKIDRVEQLGELKASLEIKKGVELANQRDLKRQIEASIDKVTGYDKLGKEYTTEQLNIVNGK